MKILIAASEAVPYIKTGGLGDVAGTLAMELAKAGEEVVLAIPFHQAINRSKFKLTQLFSPLIVNMGDANLYAQVWMEQRHPNLRVCLIEYGQFFDRSPIYDDHYQPYRDNGARFAFFSKACLDLVQAMDFKPDVVQANDWQTGLIPYYIKTWKFRDDFFEDTASILSIHNMGYQGQGPADILRFTGITLQQFRSDEFEDNGGINFLKGGIFYADKVSTVSPTYAQEILSEPGGSGLSQFLRRRQNDIHGILNGIDREEWNPKTDPLLPANFDCNDLVGKAKCKQALQKQFLLAENPKVPIFGLVGRLAYQKGLDLLMECIHEILQWDLQVVILGSGNPQYSGFYGDLPKHYPGKVGAYIGFDNKLAHLIEAGSDFFLMPSRYEPCGLNQMYSLVYGALPIVRRTGGLNDTVANFDPETKRGTGFVFDDMTANALKNTVGWALHTWYEDKDAYDKMQQRAMRMDFSWDKTVKEYLELYKSALHKRAHW